METIKEILMRRDNMTESEALSLIADAQQDLSERLDAGEYPYDICEEWFALEQDYIFELMEYRPKYRD
jgi:hypothetical protein